MRKIRRFIKNLLWKIKGIFIHNPSLPPNISRICFVCHGNIIRSIFAEKYMKRLVGEGSMIKICSAGIHAKEGSASPAHAIKSAKQYGIDLSGHTSKKLNLDMVEQNDLIFVMEYRQLKHCRKQFGIYKDKFFLLPLFRKDKSAYHQYNIPDPYNRSMTEFNLSFAMIKEALESFQLKRKDEK